MIARFPRDTDEILGDAENFQTTWGEEYWAQSETQFGTKWVPQKGLLGIINTINGNPRGDVGMIFWICVIQLVLSLLPGVVSCFQKCGKSEEESNNKSAFSGAGNGFVAFLIGLLGILAVKFDCKELLTTVVIMGLISLVLTCIYLLIVICGLAVFCAGADSCGDRICGLIKWVIAVVWILSASLLNIMLVIKGWPFCFGGEVSDIEIPDVTK